MLKLALLGSVVVIASTLGIGARLLAPFERNPIWLKALVWVSLSLLCCGVLWFPLGWFLPLDLNGTPAEGARTWLVFGAMGLFVVLTLSTACREVIWLVGWAIVRQVRRKASTSTKRGGLLAQSSRLAKASTFATLALTGILATTGFINARRTPAIRAVVVPIERLPATLEGLRIAQISDLHVGNTIGRTFVEDVVEAVNRLDADIIAVTGDLTDGTVEMLRQDIEPLAALRARLGAFFVTGNHEYYWGDATAWVAMVEALGLTALVNEHHVVERGGARVVIAGVSDFRAADYLLGHAPNLAASFAGAPPAAVKILLAHQPRAASEASGAGFDLQLSGHTHGGQIFPFQIAARLTQPVVSGLHRVGGMWLYVSRGTGYWGPPLRLAAPSEITLITLTSVVEGDGVAGSGVWGIIGRERPAPEVRRPVDFSQRHRLGGRLLRDAGARSRDAFFEKGLGV